MWQPGTILTASASLRWHYGHLINVSPANDHRWHRIFKLMLQDNLALVISTSETGFGTQGTKFDALLLIGGCLKVLVRADLKRALFEDTFIQ